MTENNAALYDVNSLLAAGINPNSIIPKRRQIKEQKPGLKEHIKKTLRILDEQDAVNRYVWYNLPGDLDGNLIERILYYKAQAAFFYLETDQTFYFLPFALNTSIDIYGRFKSITPLPFNGTSETKKDEHEFIVGLTRNVVNQPILEPTYDDFLNSCVLLSDYTKQISQTNIPRSVLHDPIVDTMSEVFPLARTSLINNAGVKGMRVQDDDCKAQVELASESMYRAALDGKAWIPITGPLDFQELGNGAPLKSEEYLIYLQALDNFRLSLYGLKNGGLFQKKAHMLEAEQEMNNGNVGLIYEDGLKLRQNFCNIVNSIWNLGIWCEPSETVIGVDINLNGKLTDEYDQSGLANNTPEQVMSYESEEVE